MSLIDDKILAEACGKGIRTAQQFLYQKYGRVLYAIIFRYIQDKDESKDLLHDCFLKVFDKIHLYKGDGSLEGWIKRLIVNDCISYLRVKKKIKFSDATEIQIAEEFHEEDQHASIAENFTKEDILGCLRSLPETYKVVFQLFALDGFSHRDIGIQLDITENTSRARYFRAKKYDER